MTKKALFLPVYLTFLSGQELDKSMIYSRLQNNNSSPINNFFYERKQKEITTSLIQSDLYKTFIAKPLANRKLTGQKTFQVGDTLTFYVRNIFAGYPVEINSITYDYGDVNGQWQKKYVTYTSRNNVNVHINK